MKIRTSEQLTDAIDCDLAWRKKELTSIRFVIKRSQGKPQVLATALRAGVALLYAHWEGFLKNSGELYLEFLSNQILKNCELADNFLALVARKPLLGMVESAKVHQSLSAVEFFRNRLYDTAQIPFKGVVKTQSNLSSTILKDMSVLLGVNFNLFATKSAFLDERLIRRRNTIAHGQFLEIDGSDFNEIHEEVTSMMELWKTDIANATVTKRYLLSSTDAAI